jgi:MFS family permease
VEIFVGLGLVYVVGFTLMCFKVKEGNYPPPPAKAENPWAGVSTYLRECYSHSYYLWVFLAMALAGLAFGPVNSFSVFYARSLNVSMDSYGKYLAVTYTCSLLLSYALGSLADRFHPLRVGLAAMIGYGVVVLAGAFFIRDQTTFAIFFVLHGVLSGVYFTGAAALAQKLFPRERFAQFASAAGILGAVFYIVMPTALGAFLDIIGHNYRYTFILGAILAGLASWCLLVVHGRFMRLGGPRNYVPPPV